MKNRRPGFLKPGFLKLCSVASYLVFRGQIKNIKNILAQMKEIEIF
jgi:hypothetical protein